jgi:hypothetical protein
LIARPLRSRRPSAIAGLKISIIVDAIDQVFRWRPAAHVGKKTLIAALAVLAEAPPIANGDAAKPVIFEAGMLRIAAALNHCLVAMVLGSLCTVAGIAVAQVRDKPSLLRQATAWLRDASNQGACLDGPFIPAVTANAPATFFAASDAFNRHEPPESLSRLNCKCSHIAFLTLNRWDWCCRRKHHVSRYGLFKHLSKDVLKLAHVTAVALDRRKHYGNHCERNVANHDELRYATHEHHHIAEPRGGFIRNG